MKCEMNIIRQLFNNSKLASLIVTYLLMFALFFIAHINLVYYGDDYVFRDLLEENGFIGTLSLRWETWSSRLIIESILLLVTQNIWIWKILNSIMLVILVHALSRLSFINITVGNLIFTFLLVHLYPFIDMYSAGWMATTVNYLWPLTLMTVAFIPLRELIAENSTIKKKPLFICTICAIIAANHEQAAFIMLLVGFLSFGYIRLIKKTKSFYPLVLGTIAFISVLIISICPGNQIRTTTAIINCSPNWPHWNLIDKMFIAIQTTSAIILNNTYILLIALSLFFAIGLYRKKLSFDSILLFSFYAVLIATRFICNVKGTIIKPLFSFQPNETNLYFPVVSSILLFLLHFTALFSFPYLVWRIIGNDSLPIVVLLLIGIASRLLVGFSPTFLASGNRTMIFYYFSLLYTIIYFTILIIEHKDSIYK